MIIHILLLI